MQNTDPNATQPNLSPMQGAALSIPEALGQAYAHWNAGQADQAELLCQRILAIWPGQADALHLMGLMAHAFNNIDLAIDYLRKAALVPRVPPLFLSNLAEMLRQKGNLTEAEDYARRALSADKTLPAIWNNLGIILQESGKLEEARFCLEKMLSMEPNNPQVHNNLANTYKRLGKQVLAKEHWLKALALNPQYPDPYSNLSYLLGQMSQHDEAIAYGRKAIELNPHLADAYINLAAIETARNRHNDALRWLDALLSFAPDNTIGLASKSLTLMHLDRLDEALETVNRALEFAPQNPEVINTKGFVLQALGKTSEAIDAFKKAASIPGLVNEKALTNLAILHMQEGDNQKAQAAFEELIKAYPTSAQAWFQRSDLMTFTADDPSIGQMEEILQSIEFPTDSDKMMLHFALGKAYLDIGNSAKAFEHLNLGNQMKRVTFPFSVQDSAQWLKGIETTFNKDYITNALSQSPREAKDAPIFIVGMPRSGTSLIEQILASHSKIYGAGELKYIQSMVNDFGSYPTINPPLDANRSAQLGKQYIEKISALSPDHDIVVDKMPANFLHVGLMHAILPNAKIIHCKRNAIDTCLSIYSKLFNDEQLFAYDLKELGEFYLAYESMMDHWKKVIPAENFIEIEYEDVVENIEEQARKMLDFVGLEWEAACVDFHKTKRTVKTASANQVRQPLYKSSSGRWRKHAEQLQNLLLALNYSDKDPIESSSNAAPEMVQIETKKPDAKTSAKPAPKTAKPKAKKSIS
ncbi:tetratricopeptide repeat-containing sulfotransferase family protein [Polynucleobacter sphagniphilus]|jgi:tetratricopeptide (TPR) repeat protein|uniref:tetratricopeptide repeat-containing sulfotransferase family protein n=1 Tax=Polynucleobacter sphagniphilus TaxID=1743169 RepID=UPI002474A483|nr:tetratricopeptide repeat-containing sulfotransferase family protein [Polynucleobacter sphagniphilus]MDH6300758.1 tetratricopeptide (TPR) repeat protein [Polynucleobacter sphagniphilus]